MSDNDSWIRQRYVAYGRRVELSITTSVPLSPTACNQLEAVSLQIEKLFELLAEEEKT